MTLDAFQHKLNENPETIVFQDTISVIEETYHFTPSAFQNGSLQNGANENLGSCKVFAFALQQNLNKEQTLACFGEYYFEDVLKNPLGTDHQNIRNFMKTGVEGLIFSNEVLTKKEK